MALVRFNLVRTYRPVPFPCNPLDLALTPCGETPAKIPPGVGFTLGKGPLPSAQA